MAGALERFLVAERAQLPLWLPVLFGAGIALYFALPAEPRPGAAPGAVLASLLALALALRHGFPARAAALALLAAALGFAGAEGRARAVSAPVLPERVEVTLDGRVAELSHSAAGALRLTLDRLVLHGLDPAATPERVRVTLLPADRPEVLPGARVRVHAALGPPGAPVEPGAFDFRRMAWFDRLGGIGVARGPLLTLPAAEAAGPLDALLIAISAFRAHLSQALRTALPGETGAFAAAILVGDQSGFPAEAAEALRASSLSHLLSISGLHMGLLTGFLYGAVRLLLALRPVLAQRIATRKVAALAAILGGFVYLGLAGAAVPAQRSWLMVLVFFGAILADRSAVSLRSVAVAAAVILALMPESLVEIGFQLSFAATIALVAAFEALGRAGVPLAGRGLPAQIGLVALTSLVAGTATAPFAALAFNQAAPWGLPANMLAVPVMGFWIMPAAVLAVPLAPLGLEAPALWAVGAGIDVVMWIARAVAALPWALTRIPEAAAPVILPLALGGLWLCLWAGRVRLLGLGGVLAGLLWWASAAERPALLVAEGGRQIGLLGPEGRSLLDPARDGFAARQWLSADGERPDPKAAALRAGVERRRDGASAMLGPWRVELVTRRAEPARLAALCREKVLLILPAADRAPPGPCLAFTAPDLARDGALSVRPKGEGLEIRAARAGARLWSAAAGPPEEAQ